MAADARHEEAVAHARVALACLDLTSLNDGDDAAAIDALCSKAVSRFGPVAGGCWLPLPAPATARRTSTARLRPIIRIVLLDP